MAGPCTRRNPCWNFFLTPKDELAGVAQTESSGTPTLIPVVLRAPTLAPATTRIAALSLDKKLFKQFMKAYLEAQVPNQIEVDS